MTAPRFDYARPADAPALAALIERAYRGPVAARGWTNEAELLTGPRSSPEEVERLILTPGTRFLAARSGDRLIGCALLQKDRDGAYFGMFAIDPDAQGGGLGKAIMARCEAAVGELWSARFLRLTVISLRHELIAWYERRGFRQSGRREPFPFDTATGALRRDFDLVELRKELRP
jgi:ribosomal protein S18 acetylase RimI-like enzyme